MRGLSHISYSSYMITKGAHLPALFNRVTMQPMKLREWRNPFFLLLEGRPIRL